MRLWLLLTSMWLVASSFAPLGCDDDGESGGDTDTDSDTDTDTDSDTDSDTDTDTDSDTDSDTETETDGITVLRNDSFLPGGDAAFQGGFVSGEAGAVTLGPVSETFTIEKIRFLFGGYASQQTLDLVISEDGGDADPGNEIYSGQVQLIGNDEAMHEVDLSADNLTVDGGNSIRVSLGFNHDGLPCIARDNDGIVSDVNWIYTEDSGWVESSTLGLTGDWIIRALVATQ